MAGQIVHALGAALLDFGFPPHCLGCANELEAHDDYLCPSCWREVLKSADCWV